MLNIIRGITALGLTIVMLHAVIVDNWGMATFCLILLLFGNKELE